jgi:uncharacterized Ntn-hydrolase superfamily protein
MMSVVCIPTGTTIYTFQTTLVKAHTAPIMRQPGVCVLDEDGHCSSFPGDECQDKLRSADVYQCDGKSLLSQRSVSKEMVRASAIFCTTPARLYAIIAAPLRVGHSFLICY